MTPAPGPSSPHADNVPVPSAGPSVSSINNSNAASSSSIVDNSQERASTSTAGGPKTCTRCGRCFDSSETVSSNQSSINAAPSPSSVAFAPDPSSTSHISSILAGNASTGSEAMILDDDGHHICSSCAGSETVGRESSRERRRRASLVRNQSRNARDTEMMSVDASAPIETVTQVDRSMLEEEANPDFATRTARDPSMHPWRRAPWAAASLPLRSPSDNNIMNADSNTTTTNSTAPLSISIANMGAGGDAHTSSMDIDAEFPPLVRSPRTPNPNNAAHSPRLPLSPTRTRSATSPPVTPSTLARQTSFSRSQTGSVTAAAAPTSPIVNFPSRGRNRANSTSSSTGGGGGSTAAVTSPPHGRRTSAHRRLSRSNSSQGPTTIAFADGVVLSPEGEKIEEDPYGPSAMTRPRLSTMTPKQMDIGSVSNTVLTDTLQKPAFTDWLERKEDGESEEERHKRLVWFRYNKMEPRREISKLRCTSRGRGCLFPGAIFNGTQKSGRMSYDVTVQIVNVDMASSQLCGYLNIRGLTDDWPELTTYFDAEIIGSRYGFVTGKWGATEADDMKHWSRFSPFRPLKNSLSKPGLRFNHMNKPFIFMRWKERFLVPDHRVRDINGASFAGFYYVCVELGEEEIRKGGPALVAPTSPSMGGVASPTTSPVLPAAPTFTRQRSASSRRRLHAAASLLGAEEGRGGAAATEASGGTDSTTTMTASAPPPPVAMEDVEGQSERSSMLSGSGTMGRMSGFYFHEHSEPYQQLTLQHVFQKTSSTFEMR